MSSPTEPHAQTSSQELLREFPPGDVIGGKYVVLQKLGSGMLGAVYKVKHIKLGETLALKAMRPNLVNDGVDVQRFTEEIEKAKHLNHPGIVKYFDVGEHEGVKFFTMELVEGKSLRQMMREKIEGGQTFTPQEMYAVVIQTLEILKYAHRLTIHRNLKPENILVVQEKGPDGRVRPRVKITDFAIAHVVSPTLFASSYVSRDQAWYLAPELLQYQDDAGPPADIYSVGSIFYEMLAGEPPVGRYQPPSEVNPNLSKKIDTLIEIALSASPQDRFQSAEQMIDSVKLTFADLYGGSTGTIYRVMAVIGIVVCLAAGAVTYFAIRKGPTPEQLARMEAQRREALIDQVKSKSPEMPETDRKARQGQHPDMIYVPGGYYLKGKFVGERLGSPNEYVEVERAVPGFWIDKFENPNRSEDATLPVSAGQMPANDVTWGEAVKACQSQGKQLCTEDQWEKACKGPNFDIYPYGMDFDPARCAPSGPYGTDGKPYLTGDFPRCESGHGVRDMGGGLWEWTYTRRGERFIIKGGTGQGNEEQGTRCAALADESPQFSHANLGYRCCVSEQ